jgi:hypothetical protein
VVIGSTRRRAGTIVGLLFFSRFLFLHVPISSLSFFSPVCILFLFFFVLTWVWGFVVECLCSFKDNELAFIVARRRRRQTFFVCFVVYFLFSDFFVFVLGKKNGFDFVSYGMLYWLRFSWLLWWLWWFCELLIVYGPGS